MTLTDNTTARTAPDTEYFNTDVIVTASVALPEGWTVDGLAAISPEGRRFKFFLTVEETIGSGDEETHADLTMDEFEALGPVVDYREHSITAIG